MPTSEEHMARVYAELSQVGVTAYGMTKFEAHSVHTLIQPEEHITGTVYGRYSSEGYNWHQGIILATDRRLFFLDRKAGVKHVTEFMYDSVSGIECSSAGPFMSVTLYAGIEKYGLRFVNTNCAAIFARYIEKRRLEKPAAVNVDSQAGKDKSN